MIDTLIRRFYSELWEAGDEAQASEILHPLLEFRGSLGEVKTGIDGYLDYLRAVRGALGEYRCEIRSLIVEEDRAAAEMHFSGRHRAEFLGVAATGRHVGWDGAAFFTLKEGRLSRIWVLGDLDGLRQQLGGVT